MTAPCACGRYPGQCVAPRCDRRDPQRVSQETFDAICARAERDEAEGTITTMQMIALDARADIARLNAENEALRAEKAAETARAARAEQDLARLRVNAGTRLDEAETALAAERGHAGKLAAALDEIVKNDVFWRRHGTAARVLAEYRARSIAADAKPPTWADDRLRPPRIMTGADISAEEEDDVPTDARRAPTADNKSAEDRACSRPAITETLAEALRMALACEDDPLWVRQARDALDRYAEGGAS